METLKDISLWGRRRTEKEKDKNMWKKKMSPLWDKRKRKETQPMDARRLKWAKIGFADRRETRDTVVTREIRLAVTFCVIFISF